MPGIFSQPIRRWLDRLSERLVQHRLNRNVTQDELARSGGYLPANPGAIGER